jgi:hypothetical protein
MRDVSGVTDECRHVPDECGSLLSLESIHVMSATPRQWDAFE